MRSRPSSAAAHKGRLLAPAALLLALTAVGLVASPWPLWAQSGAADSDEGGPRILTADLTRRQLVSEDTVHVSLVLVDTEPIVEVKINGVLQDLPKQDEIVVTAEIDNRKPETIVTISAKNASGHVTQNAYLVINPKAQAEAAKAAPPVVILADKWDRATPLRSARAGAASVLLGDDVYLFGGYEKVTYAYDSAKTDKGDTSEYVGTSERMQKNSRAYISGAPAFKSMVSAAAVQGKVYVFESRRLMHEYTPASGAWRTLDSPLLLNRVGPAVAAGDDIYIFGGMYGITVGELPAIAGLPGQASQAGTVAQGKTAVQASMAGSRDAKPHVEVHASPFYWRYTPSTNTWKVMGYMPVPRLGAAACKVGNTIYVVGGSDGTKVLNQVEAYNVTLGTWSIVLGLPGGRVFPACLALNGRLLLFGGQADGLSGPPLNWATLYDPNTKQWSVRANMPTARGDAAAVLLDGVTYVLGGMTEKPTDTVEIYK